MRRIKQYSALIHLLIASSLWLILAALVALISVGALAVAKAGNPVEAPTHSVTSRDALIKPAPDPLLQMAWNEGAKDCDAVNPEPLEVHAFSETTYIIRESLCRTFEAPFVYLLIGTKKALLIDTGDVADPRLMPLADTVLRLLPASGDRRLPLIIVHTHRHLDHRAGDGQFQGLEDVQVVGFDLKSVRAYFGFADWPNGLATLDLGDRSVDVLPTPGHNSTHIALYDRNTEIFFSGDFFLPGRLLIEDKRADQASAKRVADFVAARPVAHVLGAHIELNRSGKAFGWGSQYHPDEHTLAMSKEDLLELPGALEHFNGIYGRHGQTIMVNQTNALVITAVAVGSIFAIVGRYAYRLVKRH